MSLPVRSLIDIMKDLLSDVNISIDATGLRVVSMDQSKTSLVHCKIEAASLDSFECPVPHYIGVNMLNLSRVLKGLTSCDTLEMYTESVDSDVIHIVISNPDKNSKTRFELNLLDIDYEKITIDDILCSCVVTMPSNDLQRIVRDMCNLSDTIALRCKGETLELSCVGDFASQVTELGKTEHGLSFEWAAGCEDQELYDRYSGKFLATFCKASSIAPLVNICMRNEYALIVVYSTTIGELKFAVAPKAL